MIGKNQGGMRQFYPAAMLALVCFFAVFWMTFSVSDPMSRMVVLFFPNSSRADNFMAIVAAGGLVIDERAGGLVYEVQPTDQGFLPAIRAGHAWAVFAGGMFGGCAASGNNLKTTQKGGVNG